MMEAEQIRFLRIRAIEPRTNHEQRTNKEKNLFLQSGNVTKCHNPDSGDLLP